MRRSANVSFGALAATKLASVNLNEAQANPFQPDVQFRGFVASPLLGLPQGSRSIRTACASTSRSATR